jgi:6-phospho-3-hexuloisomerase
MSDLTAMRRQAVGELDGVLGAMSDAVLDALADEILAARRIVGHGVGREGLMVRALVMRLGHLGLDAHAVGEMTTPPVGAGDLLLASAGPGAFSTVLALLEVARSAGARTLVVTAQPASEAAALADVVVHVPAQTMADDRTSAALLPMGSLYEVALLLVFDLAAIRLRERTGQSPEEMRSRHTNLE